MYFRSKFIHLFASLALITPVMACNPIADITGAGTTVDADAGTGSGGGGDAGAGKITPGVCTSPYASAVIPAGTNVFPTGVLQTNFYSFQTSDGRVLLPYVNGNGELFVQAWSGGVWKTEKVFSQGTFSPLGPVNIGQGSYVAALLADRLVVVASGFPTPGGVQGLYSFTEQSDGTFSAPELITSASSYYPGAMASDPTGKKIVFVGTETVATRGIMVAERDAGGAWQLHVETTAPGYPVNVGYKKDGTLWMAYLDTGGVVLKLAHRSGLIWSDVKTLLNSPQSIDNPTVVQSTDGGRLAILWEQISGPRLADIDGMTYDFGTDTVSAPSVLFGSERMGIRKYMFTNVSFSSDGSKAIYTTYNKEDGTVHLGLLQGATFTPARSFLNAQTFPFAPAVFYNACGEAWAVHGSRLPTAPLPVNVTIDPLQDSDFGI